MSRSSRNGLLTTALLALCLSGREARGQHEPLAAERGLAAVSLAETRLGVTGSLLYITAHPDDENNSLLVRLRHGLGMRTGLLTLTRGEGGQNEIGPELGEAIGVLRTGEMMAVHRYDGAEQFFSRAYEFGYSFSVEETFEKWGEEETLGDIVRVLRLFRPDIVVTMMPDGAGGGQHHQASARLALRAIRLASDPVAFPDQVADGLEPWSVLKVYHAPFVRGGPPPGRSLTTVDTGDFDSRLGMSAAEYGAIARNSHRCQGMNASPVPGRQRAYLIPAEGTPPGDLLDGIPWAYERLRSWTGDAQRLPSSWETDLTILERVCRRERLTTVRELDAERGMQLRQALAAVLRLRDLVADLSVNKAIRKNLDTLLADEEADLRAVLERRLLTVVSARVVEPRDPSGVASATTIDGKWTPGEVAEVEVTLCVRSSSPFELRGVTIEAPEGWSVSTLGEATHAIRANELWRQRFRVAVPESARPTQPHWFRPSKDAYRHDIRVSPNEALRAFPAPILQVRIDHGPKSLGLCLRCPVLHEWYDPAVAKRRAHAVHVVPGINVRVEPELIIVPLEQRRTTTVRVHAENLLPHATRGRVRLEAPESWSVEPSSHEVLFGRENEQRVLEFEVRAPARRSAGDTILRAVVEAEGREYRTGYRPIAYHHVETRHLYREATATLRSFDVSVAHGLTVGYVMGVGDEVPVCLEQLGVKVEQLDREILASGDLSRFAAVVLGVRAYKGRDDLIANNARLIGYVAGGGVLLVQYNKYEWNRAQYGPFATSIARPHDRVTDENAPVKVLEPEHPIFQRPNKIGEADWDGWVQERGLYFLREWDARCEPLLAIEDSFEFNRGEKRGALVVAPHGKGLWMYTGLGFFRQLPAGVPGAYRLFANLISAGAGR